MTNFAPLKQSKYPVISWWWARIVSLAGLLLIITVQLFTLSAHKADVLVDGQIYFVDADCYSRMTRVQSIIDGGPWSIREHTFENWPTGTRPHTTAPLDLAILALYHVFQWMGVPESVALDVAGAWISPVIGILLTVGLWAWMGWMGLPYRWITLVLTAVSPVVVQAMKFGRPDHQSLLMLLIGAGVAAEITLWRRPKRLAAIIWGCVWGGALWVSLFEPLILFVALFLIRGFCLWGKLASREWVFAWIALVVTGSMGVWLDGWRINLDWDPAIAEFFPRWAPMLGELMSVPVFSMNWFIWGGVGIISLPFLLTWQMVGRREKICVLWATLVVLTFCLTVWQIRWASYFMLLAAMSFPFAMEGIRARTIWVNLAFVISLWPMADAWERSLYPSRDAVDRTKEIRAENKQLRRIATAMRSNQTEAFIAPWWLSPALSYWSGQPGVAGSSHQSLAGIADTAKFFMTHQTNDARSILDQRNVTWVVTDDPGRVLTTASRLLGQEPSGQSMASALSDDGRADSSYLKKLGVKQITETEFFTLYRKEEP